MRASEQIITVLGIVHMAPMPLWKAALNKVISGTGRAKVLCVGDSTTWGTGSGTGPNLRAGARVNSYPYQLAGLFAAAGIPALNEGFMGDSTRLSDYMAYDPRVTFSVNWSESVNMIGGNAFTPVVTNNDPLSVAFATSVDTVFAYHLSSTSTGTLNVNLDGGAGTTVTRPGSKVLGPVQLTAALGAHTMNFQRTGGTGNVYFGGTYAYNSAVSAIDIINCGWSGSTSTQWVTGTSSPWDPNTAITNLAPDLTIIDLGINDYINAISSSTTSANLQNLINAGKVTGDVVLVVPNPVDTGQASQASQDAGRSAILALAASNNIRVLDLVPLFGGNYVTANANGLMGNTLHPNTAGYTIFASNLKRVLLAA